MSDEDSALGFLALLVDVLVSDTSSFLPVASKGFTRHDNEDAVSDMSASGDSDDNPKSSNEGLLPSPNGTSSSNSSSSPDNGQKGTAATSAEGSRVKSLPRSGSDSGELSSESSWGSSEDGPNATEAEGASLSSLNGKAGPLKNSRMYASEMSSVSASGSDSGNTSSHGSDDGQNSDGKKPSKT